MDTRNLTICGHYNIFTIDLAKGTLEVLIRGFAILIGCEVSFAKNTD